MIWRVVDGSEGLQLVCDLVRVRVGRGFERREDQGESERGVRVAEVEASERVAESIRHVERLESAVNSLWSPERAPRAIIERIKVVARNSTLAGEPMMRDCSKSTYSLLKSFSECLDFGCEESARAKARRHRGGASRWLSSVLQLVADSYVRY